jgi:DNA-directed RNA polymerase III subunit RPC11
LLIEKTVEDFRFFCRTCPYMFKLEQKFEKKMRLERKEVDDVLGGKEAWENVDQADAQCPVTSCSSTRAYFMQIQIRSADEPMTTFYKCEKCNHQWKEG